VEFTPKKSCFLLIFIKDGAATATHDPLEVPIRRDSVNQQEAAPYKEILTTMHQQLLAQIEQHRGGLVSRAQVAAEHFDRPQDSRAQVATERDLEFALGEREMAELGDIDAALQRIESNVYGLCHDCGDAISTPRLQAAPQAFRCLACQEKAEHHRPG
jgi:DnaK suppressor protein